MDKNTAKQEQVIRYTKDKLLSASRFKESRDLIEAVLDDSKSYSIEEVQALIDKYMKGKVD